MEEWLEFEEALGRALPYALLDSSSGLIHRLASAVQGRDFLLGKQMCLADVAVFAALLPWLQELPVYAEPARALNVYLLALFMQRSMFVVSHF